MALDDPIAIDQLEISALEWRRTHSGLLVHDTHAQSARAGVLQGMVTSVSGLTATVGAGTAVVTPSVGANGSYLVSNGTATNVTLAARDATYSRRDLIILRVQDAAIDGSGNRGALLEAVTGTAAASPSSPAVPSGALLVATIVVPNGTASASVIDSRTYAGTQSVIPCTSSTRPATSAMRAGTMIYETDTQQVRVWSGSAWNMPDADTGLITSGFTSTSGFTIQQPTYYRRVGDLITVVASYAKTGGSLTSSNFNPGNSANGRPSVRIVGSWASSSGGGGVEFNNGGNFWCKSGANATFNNGDWLTVNATYLAGA